MKWDESARLILRAAVPSCADAQREDGVDRPFLPALVQKAKRGFPLQAQTTVVFEHSWCTGLPTPSPQSCKPWVRCIKVRACCRWYFRELELSGTPYQAPALRGAQPCRHPKLMGENCPYFRGCFSLCPQTYLSWLGSSQQDDVNALRLTRTGGGVQRHSWLSQPPPSQCQAHGASCCLSAWSTCLGDSFLAYISSSWR